MQLIVIELSIWDHLNLERNNKKDLLYPALVIGIFIFRKEEKERLGLEERQLIAFVINGNGEISIHWNWFGTVSTPSHSDRPRIRRRGFPRQGHFPASFEKDMMVLY